MDALSHRGDDADGLAPARQGEHSGTAHVIEQRYRRLVDHSPDAIVVHVDGLLVYINPAGVRWMAAETPEQLVGHPITEFVHPDSIGPMLMRIADLRQEGDSSQPAEAVMMRFDGTLLDVEAVSVLTVWEGIPAYQVVFRDLTAQKAAQAQLRDVERHFETVVASLDHGVAVVGRDGRVESSNPAARRIFGVTAETASNRPNNLGLDFPIVDVDGHPISADEHPLTQVLRTGDPVSGYIFGVDRVVDGRRVWLSGNYSLLDPADPIRSTVLVSFSDITAQRVATERLTHQATHDPLTGLVNRAHALTLMNEGLQRAGGGLAAVLFIDVDDLKTVNDAFGHDAGDEVLRTVARRLRRALRSGDVVARIGGDEFLALLPGAVSRSEIAAVEDRLHAGLSGQPVVINGVTVSIGASFGIIVLDEDDPRDAAQILRDADAAMYHAKNTGRGHDCYFAHHTVGEAIP